MRPEVRDEIIDSLMDEFGAVLVEQDDTLSDLITRSNCYTWGLDDYQNLRTWQEDKDRIGFSVDLHFSGEQDEEAPSPLDVISATVEGEATLDNGRWEVSDYNVLGAEYDLDYEDDEDYVDAVVSNVNYFQTFLLRSRV